MYTTCYCIAEMYNMIILFYKSPQGNCLSLRRPSGLPNSVGTAKFMGTHKLDWKHFVLQDGHRVCILNVPHRFTCLNTWPSAPGFVLGGCGTSEAGGVEIEGGAWVGLGE